MPSPNWTKIKWFNDPITPKALLQIPVKLEGISEIQYLQLDTGDWKSHLYGYQLAQILDKNDPLLELDEFILNGAIGDHSFKNFKFEHMKGFGKSRADSGQEKIGILGTDFFKDKILVIDFINDCFLISDKLEVIEYLDYKFEFISTTRNLSNSMLFRIILNGKIIDNIMYDTGSSIITLDLKSKADWEAFLSSNKTSNPGKFTASNRSGTFDVVSVDSEAVMQIGDFEYNNPRVFHPDTDMYEKCGYNGLIGNQPFFDKCIVLDFKNFRLGISRS